MKTVRIGLIGSGFIAALHMHAYRRVYGVKPEVRTVVSRSDSAVEFARRFGIQSALRDWRALLADPEIDVIDICTPPALHAEMIVACMQAGKHVICEKPFTGYFGRPGDPEPIGRNVPKSVMYERVMEEMERSSAAIRASGRLFLYAEDWVYAPAVVKIAEILRATQEKILFMKARGKSQRLACRARRAMGDDRRRRADPPGLPPAFGRVASQAGGGEGARRAHHRR